MGENKAMRQQIDVLHKINKSLAETVDSFVADANQHVNVSEAAATITKLKNEVEILSGRVSRLNRQNFDLRSTNERLKNSLNTHTKQILGEHNYNM